MTLGCKYACYEKSKTEYDFARQADMVVVSIGTNDYIHKDNDNITAEEFQTAYKAFLEYIKEKNGAGCKILCLYNVMNDTFSESIIAACAELGGAEQGFYFYQLDRAANNAHPTEEEHVAYAQIINALVTDIRSGTMQS